MLQHFLLLAERIAYVICSRLNSEFVIECDPGLGFMSEILIMSAPHLTLCELNDELRFKLRVSRRKSTLILGRI